MKASSAPAFDTSFLPDCELAFITIADTHHLLEPDMYSPGGEDSWTPDMVRDWSARSGWTLALCARISPPFVVHLGDLTQEYPESDWFHEGRRAAIRQLEDSGLEIKFAPGNMDIGDKPDPTMLAEWVDPGDLKRWDEEFGESFFSFSHGEFHFIVLNSQILNHRSLPEAMLQEKWLESELAAHAGRRIFMFMHMPPFFVSSDEPGLGSYDVIDEPARSWLLDLLERYQVEAVFAGHTHFRAFNRHGSTRIFSAPSTTTSRPGFYEAFHVKPRDQGRGDNAKLGFFLVRLAADGTRVHLIRTNGETGATPGLTAQRIVTALPLDLARPVAGAYLRLPIATESAGAIAHPYQVRHRVRDDHPFLACLELGLGHVRFPEADFGDGLQKERLRFLRDEGVGLTATTIWPETPPAGGAGRAPLTEEVDVLEVQLAGRISPNREDAIVLGRLRARNMTVSLAPIVRESRGTVHRRLRVGFRQEELPALGDTLDRLRLNVDRVVCRVEPSTSSTWEALRSMASGLPDRVSGIDFVLGLADDDEVAVSQVSEALLAAAVLPDSRLVIDPLQDLDRTIPTMHGLIDRLGNPRPAFHALRVLTTLLFVTGERWHALEAGWCPDIGGGVLTIGSDRRRLWLIPKPGSWDKAWKGSSDVIGSTLSLIDPVAATSEDVKSEPVEFSRALRRIEGPLALLVGQV